jgi:hypothetical protein
MLLARSRVAMSIKRSIVLASCLLLAIPARADDAPQPLPAVGDVVYKGLVGKALDAVPMDPNERMVLQRTSAVVSSTLTGRSLTVWVGLTNPILLIAGLIWGLYSASNINAAESNAKLDTIRVEPLAPIEPAQPQVALVIAPSETPDTNGVEPREPIEAAPPQLALVTAPQPMEEASEAAR